MRRWVAMLVLALGCGSSAADDDESETDAPPKERVTPRFIDPVSGMLQLAVTRTADLVLGVGSLTPGFTTLEIDGNDVGTLASPREVGHLELGQLTLHLGGAMIAGRHTLQLVTPDEEEPKRSVLVTVDLGSDAIGTPEASLPQSTGIAADRLATTGVDEQGLLVLLDGPQVHVLPSDGTGWSVEGMRTLDLPGLHRSPSDACLPAGARLRTDDGDDRVRLAWRVGLPGTRIDVLETSLVDESAPVEIVSAIVLDPAIVGTVEHAALDCPVLRSRMVVAELLALTDAEQPRDGDRALVSVMLRGDALSPGLIRRLAFGKVIDFDVLGPVVEITAPPHLAPLLVGTRMGDVWPMLVELDTASGTAQLRASGEHAIAALRSIERPLLTVVGAFGSRTIAAYDRGARRIVVAQLDDSTRAMPVVHAIEHTGEGPTGPMAATVVAGSPVFVVPMGLEHPAVVVTTSSATPAVRELDALRCDAVALPVTRLAHEGDAISVACLREQELHLATLRFG